VERVADSPRLGSIYSSILALGSTSPCMAPWRVAPWEQAKEKIVLTRVSDFSGSGSPRPTTPSSAGHTRTVGT
jgi:hypothetical protein